MSNRNRPWHEELNELLTEETSSHLSRARESLSKHRKRREARERRRQVKEQVRADLHREEIDRDLAKLAISELERKYSGLGILPLAAVMTLAALTVIGIVIFNPHLVPLLFMAFGLGMGAAGMLSSHSKAHRMLGQLRVIVDEDEDLLPEETVRSEARGKEPRASNGRRAAASPPEPDGDALSHRLEEACDRLEHALKTAPDEVKRFLSTQSDKTLEQLRATGRDLMRRERRLRELSAPDTEARMQADHDALEDRISRATDASVRQSLFQARAALKEKQAHHAQLEQGADRLEAERLRLSYTLEGLHAQILRLSASTGLGSGALNAPLRASLEQLQGELAALAEASEEVRQLADERLPEAIAEIDGGSAARDPLTGLRRERD